MDTLGIRVRRESDPQCERDKEGEQGTHYVRGLVKEGRSTKVVIKIIDYHICNFLSYK